MYARVARWEGAQAEALERSVAEMSRQADEEGGPPEGIPAKEMLMLTDSERGRAMAVVMFETEDDYRRGDETLEAMSPPGEGMGQRVSVERYELALRLEA